MRCTRKSSQNFSIWQRDDLVIHDMAERDLFRSLLEHEARLLDQDRLEDWLTLFTPECVYWIPSTPTGGDPRKEIAITFDDRRRLEDRVYRLRTGYAWSQKPKSRTVRLVTNVEVFDTGRTDTRMVRSNIMIAEFRGFETRCLYGWFGHRYVRAGRHVEDRGAPAQPDRLRPVHPQSEHRVVGCFVYLPRKSAGGRPPTVAGPLGSSQPLPLPNPPLARVIEMRR